MRRIMMVLSLALAPAVAAAQEHVHAPGMSHDAMAAPAPVRTPGLPGQDAYAAIAEVVARLEADSATDWSRVNLEALRQHLIDMNAVTLGASVRQTEVAGGLRMNVTGDGRTGAAIRRMLGAHAPLLDGLGDYSAVSVEIPGGARFTVRARRDGDARTVARIRGLGFIGLLTEGAHHGPHHLALARGEAMSHGH